MGGADYRSTAGDLSPAMKNQTADKERERERERETLKDAVEASRSVLRLDGGVLR